ncbi:MAG TPA: hypothetical protein VN437_06870 [Rectinemataceae bacterium]|nr:hypothetical protein [Rectinemataceae bacterium]
MTHSRKRYQKIILAMEDALTTSRNTNVAGMASAIALATELRTDYAAHVADVTAGEVTGEHKALHAAGQLATTSVVPYNLTTLLALTNDLTAKYTLHNTDAIAASPTYHQAQDTTHALAAVTAVTTLNGALTRLNDIKAKFNAHDAETTAHTTGSLHQIAADDAALGAAIFVTAGMENVKTGDLVSWAVLNDGTGNVTGVSAVAGNGGVTFTFTADPQDDAIISYCVAAE